MANIFDRLRAWRLRHGDRRSDAPAPKDWTATGKTHRPSGGAAHGSTVPPNYIPPADEGRPPH
jgi:hypothetical protein